MPRVDTLISPPPLFGISAGEILTAGRSVSKCHLLSRACWLLLLRLPLISDHYHSFNGLYRRNCHHVKELSFGSGKRRNRTCNCRFFLVNPIRGRGSLAPRHCPLPGTVVMVWFDFRRGLFAYRFNQGAYCGHLSAYAGVGRSLFLAQLAVMLPHVFRAFQVIFKSLVAFHSLFHRVLH